MAITDRTRKILWGRAANRCAMCRCVLVINATTVDREAIVGDECHIVSGAPTGPRHEPAFLKEELDLPDNLVLMCRIHHKLIDDQPETFTAAVIREQKANHEAWVVSALSEEEKVARPIRIIPIEPAPTHLARVQSGSRLASILDDAAASEFSHDEPATSQEAEVVASFFQEAQDYADLSGDLDAGDRVAFGFRLSESLRDFEDRGFWLFGTRRRHQLQGGLLEAPIPFPIAVLRAVRAGNPDIVTARIRDGESSAWGDA